jgi:hypothetical protein
VTKNKTGLDYLSTGALVMSAKKHKRKAGKHQQHFSSETKKHHTSLLSRYPRLFLSLGVGLVVIGVLLLTVGYISHARVGLSMLSLFFGVGLIIFANFSLPKKLKV